MTTWAWDRVLNMALAAGIAVAVNVHDWIRGALVFIAWLAGGAFVEFVRWLWRVRPYTVAVIRRRPD